MGMIMKCKDIKQGTVKSGKMAGKPYWTVDTDSGKRFNVFDQSAENLHPGMEFTVDLEQKGEYLNVVQGSFAVNMSSAKPATPPPPPPPPLPASNYQQERAVPDGDARQLSIERQNALTNLTTLASYNMLCETDMNNLVAKLKQRAGL